MFFLTQALLPLIADGGRIVNLSTGLTRFALPGYAAYAAMKGAVEVLTRYLAKELGSRGIAVNKENPRRQIPMLARFPGDTLPTPAPLRKPQDASRRHSGMSASGIPSAFATPLP